MPDDGKRVYICQLKCLNNHCVIGAYGVYEHMDEAVELKKQVEEAFEAACSSGFLNRECGLCHSTQLYTQVDRTSFKTAEEAKPFIDAVEQAQLATRAWLKGSQN